MRGPLGSSTTELPSGRRGFSSAMFPPIPYRPFAVRLVLRSSVVWIGVRAIVSYVAYRAQLAGILAGSAIILEWEAACASVLLVGTLAYFETVRRHEALFLGNCGVPRTSLALLTFGTALVLEVALYGGYVTWTTL